MLNLRTFMGTTHDEIRVISLCVYILGHVSTRVREQWLCMNTYVSLYWILDTIQRALPVADKHVYSCTGSMIQTKDMNVQMKNDYDLLEIMTNYVSDRVVVRCVQSNAYSVLFLRLQVLRFNRECSEYQVQVLHIQLSSDVPCNIVVISAFLSFPAIAIRLTF